MQTLNPAAVAVLTLVAGLMAARLGVTAKMLSWKPGRPRPLLSIRWHRRARRHT